MTDEGELQPIVRLHWLCGKSANDGYIVYMYVWQSRVEIEDYSVAYFDRIAAFEVLYH